MKTKPSVRLLLLNLLIVASLGVLMRYKIAFEFPFFNQKNIQHAHSYFAFSGWVTQALLFFISHLYEPYFGKKNTKKINTIIWLNLFSSYGMLVSFFIQGYSVFSIIFSSFSILLMIAYAFLFYECTKGLLKNLQSLKWIYAALFFALLSSAGTGVLAYLMMHKITSQFLYLSSIYFYLHFQYNGWFFFACLGILIGIANKNNFALKREYLIYILFATSCVPAYFLSTLWANPPDWIYLLCTAAAITQAIAWALLIINLLNQLKLARVSKLTKFLIHFIIIAASIKFILQLGSTIPSVSNLAFGFRPIVIAYLHLVLLAFISMMLILCMWSSNLLIKSKQLDFSIYSFAFLVFTNELALGVQGATSIVYLSIPNINIILFGISIGLFLSILLMLISQRKSGYICSSDFKNI